MGSSMKRRCRIISSLQSCATRGTAWSVIITGRGNKVLIIPLFGRRVIMTLQSFCINPDVWRPLQASPYRSYVQGPSGADHCNLYVRLEHLTLDIDPLRSIWAFALMWCTLIHPREIRIIAHITQMIYAIIWRGYVQMISRDLSMPVKGFCITRKPEHHVPPGGTAEQRLPAPLAGAFCLTTF